MSKNREERQCTICHQTYRYCSCAQYAHLPRWMDAYCQKNCHDLYNVTAGYINHWMEPEEEIARLQKLDLSYFDRLPEWMQKTITEMQNYDAVKPDVLSQVLDEPIEHGQQDDEAKQSESSSPALSDVDEHSPQVNVEHPEAEHPEVGKPDMEQRDAVQENTEQIEKKDLDTVDVKSNEYNRKQYKSYGNKPYKKGDYSHKAN